MGSSRLRRAPWELLPDWVQVRFRWEPEPSRASQKRTLLGARQGTPALNQLFYSLGAPGATPSPTPSEEDPTSGCQDVWSEGARAGALGTPGREPCPLAVDAEETKGSGSYLPAKARLRSSSSAPGVSVLQPARTPANSPTPRVRKATDSPMLEEAAALAKGTGLRMLM